MPLHSIEEVFQAFKGLRVLIIGDVMLDNYIYGSVKRISPEAPVPVVTVHKKQKRLGGAANVALNLQALGAIPVLCSIVGDDEEGEDFCLLLKGHHLTSNGIIKSRNRITTVKNRVLSGSQHLLRIDSEMDHPLNAVDKKSLIGHIYELLKETDLVIFEDYDKGCLDQEVIEQAIGMARQLQLPTAVDPKIRNFLYYAGCTLIKPNLKELKEGAHIDLDPSDPAGIEAGVEGLRQKMEFGYALITLADRGVFFQSENENGLHPAHLRSIADVSGAGDTVISIAGLCLALRLPLSFIAGLANLGGGIVCERQGVVPIDAERLKEEAMNNRILVDQLH